MTLVSYLFLLHIEDAQGMLFDLAHRVGQKSAATRPIVVIFHYYSDREKVRQALFNCVIFRKTANFGVGAQLPKVIRDARKHEKGQGRGKGGHTVKQASFNYKVNLLITVISESVLSIRK